MGSSTSPTPTNANETCDADTQHKKNDAASVPANSNHATTTSTVANNASNKKKKKPLQHLLAGGTAGFVESSICHPLDTIKTRMQLRRQNTLKTGMQGRALGSLRDAAATVGGSLRDVPTLDRSKVGNNVGEARAGAESKASSSMAKKTATTTVRVKPNVSKAKNATTATKMRNSALHDVGWKQRVPVPSTASTVTSTTVKASAATGAIRSTLKSTGGTGTPVIAPLGPFGTAKRIVQREGFTALYKGLTAVYTGIVPKMAIRFVSFEYYRDVLSGWLHRRNYESITNGTLTQPHLASTTTPPPPPPSAIFLAGLLSGLTEAVLIVTPAEVCKIRMQSQYHSMMDPSQLLHAKYKNVAQTAVLVAREEGLGALYKGVVPTMLRQGCNQAVNFTVYNSVKRWVLERRRREAVPDRGDGAADNVQLDHWESLVLGGLSGGMGPLANNPLDVVKTRMQKQVIHPGKDPKYKSLVQSCIVIAKEEGTPALWKGITPRLMRIMPGQAITFMTYEAVSARMEKYGLFD